MAYRPQYKDKNGNMVDLPLDAETVRGKEVYSKEETETLISEKLDEKQITECNCSHENEITGFGEEDCNLVIDDQDVIITKIQGQTRRKSLNLFSFIGSETRTGNGNTITLNNSILTISGTNTSDGSYFGEFNFSEPIKENKTYTISIPNNHGISIIFYDSNGNEVTQTNYVNLFTFTPNADIVKFSIWIIANNYDWGTTIIQLMLNEGSTALPYEPYDNTLVNSKCDFVSTGRNLAYKKEKGNWGIYLTCNYLEKGKMYYVSDKGALSSLKLVDIYICDKNKENDTIVTSQAYFYFSNGIEFTIPTNLSFNPYVVYVKINSNDFTDLSTVMLNYGDTVLPYEPYIEDTMQCGLELGAFDYHDNVNHITHRQTSGMITLNGSENWYSWSTSDDSKPRFRLDNKISNSGTSTSEINVASNFIDKSTGDTWGLQNGISIDSNVIYVYVEGITTIDDFKSWLQANPITLVYKLATETTEENILPSGYKVWYKGMQVQKTDTIPYILTKQYAISLASQVLNNVSVDRSQQKQLDELYKNKANASDVYKKSETDSLLNGRFGQWKFENGTLYSGVNPIVGDYYELVGTCTTLGNEDYDTIIIGYDSRPKYFEAGANKVKDIALLEDIPHLYRHQISFSESALSQVSFEINLAYPTAINTKDKIKAILTDNYYTSIQRPKDAIGMSLGQGYIFDAIYINNGELFAREITTPSTSISIEGICVSIEDKITQIF